MQNAAIIRQTDRQDILRALLCSYKFGNLSHMINTPYATTMPTDRQQRSVGHCFILKEGADDG